MKKEIENLTKNFKNFFKETGAKKVILGISGGVDSAVTLQILLQAIGKEKIFGLLLPHRDFSSLENLNDARELAKKAKINFKEIEISPFCNQFFKLDFCQKKMVRGNLMARIRANLLFTAANHYSGIVAGTGNKTEILLGFFTKFGDGAVDCEILGEIWKTEVFAMAKIFDLTKIAKKSPTAELFTGQTDENEIGANYLEIDKILQKILLGNFSAKNEVEKNIFERFKNNSHKRNLPTIISKN